MSVEALAVAVTTTTFDEAFGALFSAEYQRVFRVVHRMSGDVELASDITQDAFVRLYKRGSLPDLPAAWLITVALNLYRNAHATRRRRQKLLTIERGSRAHSDPAPSPDSMVLSEAAMRSVRAALDQLPERERQMLLLRAEGYSYRDIASALDVHESSVGTLLARAVRAFREHYHDATDSP
jgi:RNA polymerase sigma factor (sigma-70 family)